MGEAEWRSGVFSANKADQIVTVPAQVTEMCEKPRIKIEEMELVTLRPP